MAVGITEEPHLLPVSGINLAACSAGIYKKKRSDLAIIAADPGTRIAALFTRNAFCAAPVILAKEHLKKCEDPLYLLINAGNANAGMGKAGYEDGLKTCKYLAELVEVSEKFILPFSTGVIGEPLPVEKIQKAIPHLLDTLSEDSWGEVNRAIMTTDTVPKGISREINFEGKKLTITAIAKGSGMIRPDMATMLAFIGTDAAIEKGLMQEMLEYAVEHSFNRISVDGDTSTNDACVLIATGKSNVPLIDTMDSDAGLKFREVLTEVCVFLAQAIVRDGEGATKFVTLHITNGESKEECLAVATAISHSPLIKTALFASDPNWGRILAAVGRSGLGNFDVNKVSIYIDDVCIVNDGERSPGYTEATGKKIFQKDEILIRISLGRGNHALKFWTCDLSYDYVRINAEYRT